MASGKPRRHGGGKRRVGDTERGRQGDRPRRGLVFSQSPVPEYLAPFPLTEHGRQLSGLQRLFFCPAFDVHAASIAADLWRRHRKLPKDKQVSDRTRLKADIQIIATAKASGVERFYSNDAGCRSIAKLVMRAFDLPTSTGNAFADNDIKSGEY